MDPTYLKAEDRSQKDIKGVIGLSGVYRLEDLKVDLKLSITGAGENFKYATEVNLFAAVFGTDPEVLKQASPLTHVRPGLPPFLLMNGGLDYGSLRKMTKEFTAALKDAGNEVQTKELSRRTHETLVFDILNQTAEPKMVEAIVDFINKGKREPAR